MAVERIGVIAVLNDKVSQGFIKIERQGKKTFDSLDREIDQTQRNLNQTKRPIQGVQGSLSNLSSKGIGGLKSSLLGALPAMGAFVGIAGLGMIGKSIVSLGAQMEQTRIAFATFLRGDEQAANGLLNQLNQFANATPFTNQQVIKASRTLLAFGFAANEVQPTLKMLGDISAGTGKDLSELGVIFGQIKGAGRLMGQDLLQLINAGFNPLQVMSEKTGKSVSVLKDEMSKGAISFEMVKDAFKSATSEGGLFFNLMQKQSKSLSGLFSTMQGKIELIGIKIGESMGGGLKTIVSAGIGVVNFINDNLSSIGSIFGQLSGVLDPVIDAFQNLFESFGYGSQSGSVLRDIFNRIGLTFKIYSPIFSGVFKIFAGGINIISSLIKGVSTFLQKIPLLGKVTSGIVISIQSMFKTLSDAIAQMFKGTGDLILGIFSGDIDKIKSGLYNLTNGAGSGTLGVGVAGAKGFQQGFTNGLGFKDFFSQTGKNSNNVQLPGSSAGSLNSTLSGLGAGAQSNLSNGLSSVREDSRASRNVIINVENMIREFQVISDDATQIAETVREELNRAFSEVLSDASYIVGGQAK